MIWQLWGHRSVWGHIYGDTQHARGQGVTPCTWWVAFWGGEVDIITFSWPKLLLASANDILLLMFAHINPPLIQCTASLARPEPRTGSRCILTQWLCLHLGYGVESRINEILLCCWQQSASWPRSYWRKIIRLPQLVKAPDADGWGDKSCLFPALAAKRRPGEMTRDLGTKVWLRTSAV